MRTLLIIVHSGTAIVLFSVAMISVTLAVLIAVRPAVDHGNAELLRKAKTVGRIEGFVAVVLTLTGLITVFASPWSFSQSWVWMSLMAMVFYSAALFFITNRSRLVVAKGGSAVKCGMQVNLQMGHVLLLIFVLALMYVKPA